MHKALGRDGEGIPVPSKVVFAPEDDFEGDPIIRLTVEFPAEIPAEETAWKRVYPLLEKLSSLVAEQTGHERMVMTEIRRLAETRES